jgi:hypothetical protein
MSFVTGTISQSMLESLRGEESLPAETAVLEDNLIETGFTSFARAWGLVAAFKGAFTDFDLAAIFGFIDTFSFAFALDFVFVFDLTTIFHILTWKMDTDLRLFLKGRLVRLPLHFPH